MIAATDATDDFFPLNEKVTLHYKTWGTRSSIPVLFVHVSCVLLRFVSTQFLKALLLHVILAGRSWKWLCRVSIAWPVLVSPLCCFLLLCITHLYGYYCSLIYISCCEGMIMLTFSMRTDILLLKLIKEDVGCQHHLCKQIFATCKSTWVSLLIKCPKTLNEFANIYKLRNGWSLAVLGDRLLVRCTLIMYACT